MATKDVELAALDALGRIAGGARTSEALQAALRCRPRLGAEERGFVAGTVHGAVALRRWLDLVLGEAASDAARWREVAAPDLARARAAKERLAKVEDPIERLAIERSLPSWLARRLAAELGLEGADLLGAALLERGPQSIRVNRVRTTREALAARLQSEGIAAEPSSLAPDGLRVTARSNLFRLRSFQEGLFEVQDEGSQLVAEVVAPPPGSAAIDACAGAGGKTLHLAALLQNRGKVFALDAPEASHRLEELRRRARRAGLHNVEVRSEPPTEPAARVLVDAPCSGIGTLRRHPDARWRLSEESMERLPAQQLEILERAAEWVNAGGRLIYATCTVLSAENDEVIETFLARNQAFTRMPLKEIWGRARAESVGDGIHLRLLPHRHGTDGFFASVLRRG